MESLVENSGEILKDVNISLMLVDGLQNFLIITLTTLLREGLLQRLLRKLQKMNIFTKDIYNKIYPTGSQPSRLYGLPKLHKTKNSSEVPPFRPIVSSIGSFNYNLAKYLCDILTPLIPAEHTTKDTFAFVKDVQQVSASGKFLVSYDVCSLFTNIPFNETITMAVDTILESAPEKKISRVKLRKLFEFATSQTQFHFNSQVFDQIDGVAMGSPLAPALANLFLGNQEKVWSSNPESNNVLFYRRYVDDIFCIFENESHADTFLSFLNKHHPNIQFTIEKEASKTLPFLDVLVNTSGNIINASLYRKRTFTGSLTNFISFTSYKEITKYLAVAIFFFCSQKGAGLTHCMIKS